MNIGGMGGRGGYSMEGCRRCYMQMMLLTVEPEKEAAGAVNCLLRRCTRMTTIYSIKRKVSMSDEQGGASME